MDNTFSDINNPSKTAYVLYRRQQANYKKNNATTFLEQSASNVPRQLFEEKMEKLQPPTPNKIK